MLKCLSFHLEKKPFSLFMEPVKMILCWLWTKRWSLLSYSLEFVEEVDLLNMLTNIYRQSTYNHNIEKQDKYYADEFSLDQFLLYVLGLLSDKILLIQRMQSLVENSVAVSTVSRHLQQIITDTYQMRTPKGSSTLHDQLYIYLNQIQQKIDACRSTSGIKIDQMLQQKIFEQQSKHKQLLAQNDDLKYKMEQDRIQKYAITEQKISLKHQLNLQKNQYLKQILNLKNKFMEQLKVKVSQFERELYKFKQVKYNNLHIEESYKAMGVHVEDFKSLINKLHEENKLLKQQRQQLITKLDDLIGREQTIPTQNDTDHAHKDKNQQLPLQLQQYRQQIIYKKEAIEKTNRQLALIRSFTVQGNNRKTNIVSSQQDIKHRNGQSNDLSQMANDHQGQQQRMMELQQLRKLDQQAIKSLEKAISQLTNKVNNNIESTIDGHEMTVQSLEERIKELQVNINASIEENKQLTIKFNAKQEEARRLQEKFKSTTDIIRQLEYNLRRKEEEINEERATSANLSNMMTENNTFVEQIMKENEQMREKLSQCITQISGMDVLIKQKEKQNKQLLNQHQHQIRENQKSYTQSRLGLTQLEAAVQQFQTKLLSKDKQIQQMELATKQKAQKLIQSSLQLNDKARKIKRLQEAVKQYEQKLIISENKYKDLFNSIDFQQKHPQESDTLALFPGDILQDEPQYKLFLRQILQKRSGKTIRRTKTIYKRDPLNKINFHAYIDDHEQIVLLVRLANGYVIAAYSEGKILPKTVSTKDGLIISLTNRQVFQPLEKNRKVVTYDEFFLIIGNSEFRLRSQEAKFFSNFGIANGYFKTRGKKVDVLTGTLEREVQMNALQVHQIEFL